MYTPGPHHHWDVHTWPEAGVVLKNMHENPNCRDGDDEGLSLPPPLAAGGA